MFKSGGQRETKFLLRGDERGINFHIVLYATVIHGNLMSKYVGFSTVLN